MNAATPRNGQTLTPWRPPSMAIDCQFGETGADGLAAEDFSPADMIATR